MQPIWKMTAVMAVTSLVLGGCATVKLSADRLQGNEASIRGAEELGAMHIPAARLHLQLAKDQAATAKRLAAEGDDRAALVLVCAQADAELALGLAREASVHGAAVKAAEDLKSVLERGTP